MSSERFSLTEFSEFLDDSDGHRLAQFLQKKSGDVRPGGRRIFNSDPERFSLEVRLKRISTPSISIKDTIKEKVNEDSNCDGAQPILNAIEKNENAFNLPESTANRELKLANIGSVGDPETKNKEPFRTGEQSIMKEIGVSVSAPSPPNTQTTSQSQPGFKVPGPKEKMGEKLENSVFPTKEPVLPPSSVQPSNKEEVLSHCNSPLRPTSLPVTPRSVRFISPRSPKSNIVRSGGGTIADRLRRQVLNRRSSLANSGKRTLLKEFESTISSPDFAPQICSTPMSQKPSEILGTNSPIISQDVQRQLTNRLSKQDEAVMKSMIVEALEESMKRLKNFDNTDRMQISATCEKTLIENPHLRTITTPMSITNVTVLPETQELIQKAQAQTSSKAQGNKSHGPTTQELLQEVRNTLKEISSSNIQPSKIVIPVNQTFTSVPTTAKSQSEVIELAKNNDNPENTLSGAVVRNDNVNHIHDTLTQSHASLYPDIQSFTEATQQNVSTNSVKTNAFVNHPTFTHTKTPILQISNEINSSKTKCSCSYADKGAETLRAHTQHRHNLCNYSVIHDQKSLHSRSCIEPQQVSHRQYMSSANSCTRPIREQSIPINSKMNTSEIERRENGQHECQHSDRIITQHPSEAMGAGASHSQTPQCSTTKHNYSYTNKGAETVKEHSQVECCSPRKSKVRDLREESHSRLRNTIHNDSCHSIIQDPDQQLNSGHKSISFIDKPVSCSVNSPTSNIKNQSLADGRPRRSILKNRNMSPVKYCNAIINENTVVTNSPLITEDEDVDETQIRNAKMRVTRRSGPLNLAPERRMPVTRSRRKRKFTPSNAVTSSIITTDTDGETGLPPAHPLNLRHTRHGEYIMQQKSKRPLNKPPNTPKNGEKFAEELKAHLARLTNLEILDLRKRNSIGEALIAPTRMRKSAVSIERAFKQKLQIEEQIQLEILRRELLGEAEGLHETLEPNVGTENEGDDTNVDDTEIIEELKEFPSAPDVFKDNNSIAANQRDKMLSSVTTNFEDNNISTSQCYKTLLNATTSMQTYNSSLIDDNSTERVTFIQPNNSFQRKKLRARKKKCEEMPEITKKYIEIQKKIKKHRQPNISKRSLYSKGDSPGASDENEGNISSEKENCSQASAAIEPIPPPPNFTPTRRLTNLHIPSPPPPLVISPTPERGRAPPLPSPISTTPFCKEQSSPAKFICASTSAREHSLPPPPALFSSKSPSREISSPPPPSSPSLGEYVSPPVPFLDNCNSTSKSSVNVATTSSRKPLNTTKVANCQTDDELFKKPTMPAPRGRPRKRKFSQNIDTPRQVESSETESAEDAEGVRRSKRGQVPRKQSFLCGIQNGPPLLYSLMAAVEKRSIKAKLKRLEKTRSGSLNSNMCPVASSTVNKARKKTRGGPRQRNIITEEFSYLGDSNTTSGTISNSKSAHYNTAIEKLQAIEEKSMESDGEVLPLENDGVLETGQDTSILETATAICTQDMGSSKGEVVSNKASGYRSKPMAVEKKKKSKAKGNQLPVERGEEIAKETDDSACNRSPPIPSDKLHKMFEQLKRNENESPAINTKSEVATEVIKNKYSRSKSKHKAGQKNKNQKRKVKATETQSPVITVPTIANVREKINNIRDIQSTNGTGTSNQTEILGNSHCIPQNGTPVISSQSEAFTLAEDKNDKASGTSSKPKAVEKNKKQKRKVKATGTQLPAQQNTSTTKDTVSNVTENITDRVSVYANGATNRTGLFEHSRCNGPPPPPRDKLNEMFDQLKNAANNQPQSDDSSSTSSSRTRNVRVRLRRATPLNEIATSSADSDATTPSAASTRGQNGAQSELYAWLRNVSHSAESNNTPDVGIFREMRASTAGNLHFTDLHGVDYAFYDTVDKSSLGYLRFQPLQHKPSKRAKKYNLHFVVLAGTFRFGTDNEHGVFGLGDMVAINIGKRYNITNMENDIGILMVIKK